MTRKADYTGHEWALLKTAPELIVLGMLSVSQSGLIGKLRELTALCTCLTLPAVPIQFKRNELVLALIEDTRVQDFGPFAYLARGDVRGMRAAIADARLRTPTYCEWVAALLAAKTTWTEMDGVKRWLLWVATSIAEASGDGWLGIGRKVSGEEVKMLHQIASSLGIAMIAPVPTATELEVMLGLAPRDTDSVSRSGDSHDHYRSSDR